MNFTSEGSDFCHWSASLFIIFMPCKYQTHFLIVNMIQTVNFLFEKKYVFQIKNHKTQSWTTQEFLTDGNMQICFS